MKGSGPDDGTAPGLTGRAPKPPAAHRADSTPGQVDPPMLPDDKTSILIVDDLPEKILAYRTVLEELGQTLVTATSGAEALKQVLRNDFAVILLDVNMPDMDGFETARLIRERRLSAHIPIIFLTAFADELRIAESYATGGVDFLSTPVVPEVLRAKVRVFVDLYRLRQQVAHQAQEQARAAAAEEAARRFEFLAEASGTLTRSLDFDATLRGLLRLAVPRLADLAAVTQASDEGGDWRSEFARAEAGEVRFQTLTDAEVPRDALREAHDRVLTSGVTLSIDGMEIVNPFGADAPPVQLCSALILPLQARGRILGALTLAQSEPGRGPDAADLVFVRDLAGRAAIALDNALLVRSIRENDLRKDEFLAMLAHELRNPLAPIRTGLDLLELSGADAEIVEPMQRQVDHLVRLVDDLLDVSRITRGAISLKQQVVDLRSIVSSAVETSRPLIEDRAQSLGVSLASEPLVVNGDPVRLTQVLTNLLNNAARYTPDGGDISLSVERNGADAVLCVRDNGAGISPEMLSKIFDLFVQADRSLDRSKGGLGIGLTLVRRLAEMHGGSVHVSSRGLGRGSEFTLHLPLHSDARSLPAKDDQEPEGSDAGSIRRRVLVVDDNRDAAVTLQMLLRLGGHEVRVAYDGPGALDVADEFAPDTVLLDIGLPGLDGYEVARRLRSNPGTAHSLLIAVSGYGQDTDRLRSQQSGFNQHLVKPVDVDVLQRVLAGK